jgi:hypothetical protein
MLWIEREQMLEYSFSASGGILESEASLLSLYVHSDYTTVSSFSIACQYQ